VSEERDVDDEEKEDGEDEVGDGRAEKKGLESVRGGQVGREDRVGIEEGKVKGEEVEL
jgi:hypothetical protein